MDKKSIIKEYFSEIGAKGGKSKSKRKLAAIASNARRGGRPRIPDADLTDEQRKRRERYERQKAKSEAKK